MVLGSGSLCTSMKGLSGSPAQRIELCIWEDQMAGPTPVLGTHDNRLPWAGSEVDVRAAGVRSLTTLTLSLHEMPSKFRGKVELVER